MPVQNRIHDFTSLLSDDTLVESLDQLLRKAIVSHFFYSDFALLSIIAVFESDEHINGSLLRHR